MVLIEKLLVTIVVTIALAGCNKKVTDIAPDDSTRVAKLSFFNGSQELIRQVSSGPSLKYYSWVLINSQDTSYGRDEYRRLDSSFPYFSKEYPMNYPAPVNSNMPVPWISYTYVPVGSHDVTLMDIGHNLILHQKVEAAADAPVSIFFTDNLGQYSTFSIKDTLVPKPEHFGIRVINLCPDADITFTINNKTEAAYPASMKFKDYTSFIQTRSNGSDTLRFRLFRKDEPETALVRNTLYPLPGHGYTVVITGYTRQQIYISSLNGLPVSVDANVNIRLYKSY